MFKKILGYDVRIDDVTKKVTGVFVGDKLCAVYKWNKKLNCYCNILPLSESVFRSGIYSGRYHFF